MEFRKYSESRTSKFQNELPAPTPDAGVYCAPNGGTPMTTTHTSAEVVERDGVLVGPLREPRNLAANVAGSIHDDSQAQRLGVPGGTAAGRIHLEEFPPLPPRP